jgi:hypothetical protein
LPCHAIRHSHASGAAADAELAPGAREEAVLIQRLWRHLVPAAEAEAEAAVGTAAMLQASDLLRFMALALQPTPAAADAEGEGGGEPGAAAGAAGSSSAEPAADAALLSDFAALYRNTLSYKSTRNVRSSTVDTALDVDVAGCTFKPTIDAKSRALEQHRSSAKAHSIAEHSAVAWHSMA